MNPLLPSSRRTAKEECRPGDWVEALLIPEWTGMEGRRSFTPDSVSISPESGRLGGMIPEASRQTWEFESQTNGARRYWVRIS